MAELTKTMFSVILPEGRVAEPEERRVIYGYVFHSSCDTECTCITCSLSFINSILKRMLTVHEACYCLQVNATILLIAGF